VVVSFDQIEHSWMIKFVEHRIGDRRIVRLIQKWLKGGVMEQGRWFEAEEGTPQGAVISNLPFSKWEAIFKDPMTTAAAIDRLVHHSVILELNIPSYRMEQAKKKKVDGE
jgi:retron-type reverse transcriptase